VRTADPAQHVSPAVGAGRGRTDLVHPWRDLDAGDHQLLPRYPEELYPTKLLIFVRAAAARTDHAAGPTLLGRQGAGFSGIELTTASPPAPFIQSVGAGGDLVAELRQRASDHAARTRHPGIHSVLRAWEVEGAAWQNGRLVGTVASASSRSNPGRGSAAQRRVT